MKKYLLTIVALIVLTVNQSAFAALSAIVSSSPSTAIINQPVTLNVAINNTGSALTLNNLQLTVSYNGATTSRVPSAFSVYVPSSVQLAANATTSVPVSGVFFSPSTGITGSGTGKYYVGALIYTSDGSVTSAATSAQVTVNPIPLPAYERQ